MAESPIQVESYRDLAFEKAWGTRTAGFWGSSAVGLIYGAVIGVAAPFIPCLANAQTLAGAAALIPSSMAVFGAVGIGTGFAIGAAVGAPAGAAASVAEEQERRMRERDIALGVSTPEAEASISRQSRAADTDTRSLVRRFVEGMDVKVGATLALVGMLGGAVMAAAYFALNGGVGAPAMPAMHMLLGEAAGNSTAVTTYFIGIMGLFGASFATNAPLLVTHMQNVVGRLFSGELLGSTKEPAIEPERIKLKMAQPDTDIGQMPEDVKRCFESFQALLAEQEKLSREMHLR